MCPACLASAAPVIAGAASGSAALALVVSDFSFDYGVSFPKEDVAKDRVAYNYANSPAFGSEDLHGLSAFYKDAAGTVFHTYSTYGRGCDMLVGAYNFLDLAPKGRDEDGLSFTMGWVRHHDRYGK